MGAYSQRAFCPNCGEKIHTQRGVFSPIRKTGTTCPFCHVALTGKVTMKNTAVLADPPPPTSR